MMDAPLCEELRLQLDAYLAANYIPPTPQLCGLPAAPRERRPALSGANAAPAGKKARKNALQDLLGAARPRSEERESALCEAALPKAVEAGADVHSFVREKEEDESFTEAMLRIIRERDWTEPEVYNRVFMDRKLFNKIRNDPEYRPSKRTALLLAIALQLDLPETQEFIAKAGFVITHASKSDLIIEFFILKGNYDILQINEMLEEYGQPLLMKCG